ncbi:hypothetical protein JK636_23100 [Clostridium sp. YIM B02515]|uniref:LPS export ABC transporter periplasmic protein LptC n=1 Tax=Clostridium rhizosphaerae TaxID=2803861 RepID=A0ABS1TGT7_9CLOT|nr:hypothetical protein [Clostridium rhizosphaerae]MBL4938596.1 hypothetical protein [Clostridium rhizosphaerae]
MKARKSILSAVLVSTIVISSLFTGCGPKPAPAPAPSSPNTTNQQNTNQKTPPDAVTTASIVDNEAAFLKATSKDGRWIIAIVKDLTISKDIILEGDFKNSKGDLQRKLALYTQDSNKKVTNRFTLTAPKMVVKSPNASIQHGTFKGDVYVETKDFQLIDAKVDGNIYFNSDEAKAGFKMDADSSVTGKREVKKS